MTVAPASPDIAEASVREFRKGHIQDLSLDRDHQDAWLRKHPVTDEASLRTLEDRIASLRRDEPLAADDPLWGHPGVTVTPHISAVTLARSCAGQIAENYRRMQGGRPLINAVDPAREY